MFGYFVFGSSLADAVSRTGCGDFGPCGNSSVLGASSSLDLCFFFLGPWPDARLRTCSPAVPPAQPGIFWGADVHAQRRSPRCVRDRGPARGWIRERSRRRFPGAGLRQDPEKHDLEFLRQRRAPEPVDRDQDDGQDVQLDQKQQTWLHKVSATRSQRQLCRPALLLQAGLHRGTCGPADLGPPLADGKKTLTW